MSLVRPITRHDIKGPKLYGPIRDDYRKRVIEMKRSRRILVGDRDACRACIDQALARGVG